MVSGSEESIRWEAARKDGVRRNHMEEWASTAMLTVLIATYNGAKTLPKALNGYVHLQSPPGGWKLVIVDNGSTDGTKEIIHSFADRLPLTYLFEPVRGKNAALNTGLPSVAGDLVVLTDDDTLPRPDWLIEMRRAADTHTSFSIFAGAVVPRWTIAPEEWILRLVPLAPVFGVTDPAWEEGPISHQLVFGGNAAIRTEVFEAGYRFNVQVGPRGHSYAMGSETELTLRLSDAGFKAWHCKQAVVEHIIQEFQLQQRWLFGRAIRYGRGEYRLKFQYANVNCKFCLGIPTYLIKEIVRQGRYVGQAKLWGDAAEFFQDCWTFNYLLGQVIEARRIHKELRSARSQLG